MVVPFLTVYLTVERQFTLEQAGWVMSCFGAGGLLGSWQGGWLTDRVGFFRVQIWSMGLSGLVFLLLGSLQSFESLCIGVFLLSSISDAFRPANLTAVSAYSTPENLTRSLSLVRMAINLGWSIGPAIGGFLAAGIGYYWLFVADGGTCILAALMLWWFLPEQSRKVSRSSETESTTRPYRPPHRDRAFLYFLLMIILVAICFMQFLYTLPVYFKKQLLLSEYQIGLLLALNGLLIAVLEVTTVYVLENRFSRILLCGIGAVLLGIAFLVLNLHPTATIIAIVCMVFLTIGEMLNFPFANSFALSRSEPATKGRYMAYYTMAFAIATIIAPAAGLKMADALGFFNLWLIMGSAGVLAGIGIWLTPLIDRKR